MGHYKQNRLKNKYNSRKTEKEFHLTQAKFSKFGAIFAGASTGISAIAAIMNYIEDKDDNAAILAFFALMCGLVCNFAYGTHKESTKHARKAHNQMRKAQRAYAKTQKQH
ncbi:MAG: hypothetical protein E7006_02855 [Alphaproteobacteria bacterium]|nr:hypothetical protein [Alphaproteobacteria bacterium]